MKKTLLLAAAALLGFSASADTGYFLGQTVTNAADLTSGKYFIVAAGKTHEGFIKMRAGDNYPFYKENVQSFPLGTTDASYIFEVTVTPGEGENPSTFTVKSLSDNRYIAYNGNQADGQGHVAAHATDKIANLAIDTDFTYTKAEGMNQAAYFAVYQTNVTRAYGNDGLGERAPYIHVNGSGFGNEHLAWWGKGDFNFSEANPSQTLLTFIKADERSIVETSYVFPVIGTFKVIAPINGDAADYLPTFPLFSEVTLQETNTTITADNNTFTVVGEPNFDQVFRMSLRNKASNDCKNFFYNDTENKIKTRNNTQEGQLVPERLFYLKKAANYSESNPVVTLHSIAAKDEYGFQVSAVNNEKGSMTTTPTEFIIVNNAWENNNFGGFSLQHPEKYRNMNSHINDIEGSLGVWNNGTTSQNDDGSCIRLYALTDAEIDAFAYVSQAAKTAAATAAKENKSIANIRAIFDGGQVDEETLLANYFRVQFTRGNKYVGVVGYANETGAIAEGDDGAHNLVEQVASNGTDMSQIWHFTSASSERAAYPIYGICSANANGYYLKGNHLSSSLEQAYKYRLYKQNDIYVARIGGQFANTYLDCSNNNNDVTEYWGGFDDPGNTINLQPVSSITVPVADGVSYATFAFPFAVTNDAAVFAAEKTQTHATNNGSYLKLAEIEQNSTIAPATGIILDKTTSFTVVAPNEPATNSTVDNLLTGITMKRKGTFAADSHFALSGETFAKNAEATELPANSAILPVEAVTDATHKAATALALTKEDVSASISEIVAEGAAAKAVYDLQGRRVSNATKGIFIVNGKKMLVK